MLGRPLRRAALHSSAALFIPFLGRTALRFAVPALRAPVSRPRRPPFFFSLCKIKHPEGSPTNVTPALPQRSERICLPRCFLHGMILDPLQLSPSGRPLLAPGEFERIVVEQVDLHFTDAPGGPPGLLAERLTGGLQLQ